MPGGGAATAAHVNAILGIKDLMSKPLGKITKGFQKLKLVGQKALRKLTDTAKKLAKALVSPFAGLTALLSTGGIFVGLDRARKQLDEIGKTSDRIGIATEALSKLQFSAELTGVSVNAMNLGLQRMVRRVSEAAKGTGEAQGALKELGLDARELVKLDADQQFLRIADAMNLVGNQSDQLRLAFKLFDTEGTRLLVTLKQGRAALEEQWREAERSGIVFSRAAIAGVEQFNDAIFKFQAILGGGFRKLIVDLSPVLKSVVDSASEFVRSGMDEFIFGVSEAVLALTRSAVQLAKTLRALDGERWLERIGAGFIWGVDIGPGNDGLDKLDESLDTIERRIREFRERKLFGGADQSPSSGDEGRAILDRLALQNGNLFGELYQKARLAGFDLKDLANDGLGTLKKTAREAKQSYQDWIDGVRDANAAVEFEKINRIVRSVADSIESSLGRALDRAIDGTFKLRDAFKDLGREVLRTLSKLALNAGISSLFGGGSGPGLFQRIFAPRDSAGQIVTLESGGTVQLNALGNAYQGGRRVEKFGKGGVLSGPTTFPIRGGTGLAGEAGPEAYVPLGRTRKGRLGIEVADSGLGGAMSFVINLYALTPQQFEQWLALPGSKRQIRTVFQEAMATRPGGV